MTPQHFLGKISLRAVIVQDEKVLLTRDIGDPDIWEIPGGRLYEGETIEEGLKREIREELGVEIRIGRLAYTEQFRQQRDGSLHLLLAYEAFLEDPTRPLTLAPDEVAEIRWIDKTQIDEQNIYPNCLNALRMYWNLN